MDPNDNLESYGFCDTCVCGRTFTRSNALNYHKRTCSMSKKRFSVALAKAKEVWNVRKRRRVECLIEEGRQLLPQQAPDVSGSSNESVEVRVHSSSSVSLKSSNYIPEYTGTCAPTLWVPS
jgi:hypothetical protein